MSDRGHDQGGPLFPRRTLSGPAATQETEPESAETSTRRAGRRRGRGGGSGRDGGAGRDGGPPTAAMPRVDEQQDHLPRRTETARVRTAPEPTPAPAPTPARSPVPQPATDRGQLPRTETAPDQPRQRGRSPRRARLRIVRLDPWSVMKMAFALSIALAIISVVAVAIVWSVLDAAGVWESINTGYDTLVNADAGGGLDVQKYVGLDRVMGLTMVVALANVVLLTALATLGAFIYNLAAALLGGFEVTLAEDR